MPTNMTDIREFLALRRIALVGVSRDAEDFSRYLLREMCARGYDMVPVNPAAQGEFEKRQCFARVQEINPPSEGALVLTASRDTEQVVRDCAEAGIRHLWMHRSGGQGSVNQAAVDFCHEKGIHVVEGYCPFMFLAQTPFFHRVHGFLLKVAGSYPREVGKAA
jgi:predicted CoA-binding protein